MNEPDHDMLIRHDEQINQLRNTFAWIMRFLVGSGAGFILFEILKDFFK